MARTKRQDVGPLISPEAQGSAPCGSSTGGIHQARQLPLARRLAALVHSPLSAASACQLQQYVRRGVMSVARHFAKSGNT